MDDDGLSREQVERLIGQFALLASRAGWEPQSIDKISKFGDLALSALESRSEVLEEGYRQGYFDAAAGKKPSVSLLKSHRAEPGAQDDDHFNCGAEGKPCQRWCGANACLAEHEPAGAQGNDFISPLGRQESQPEFAASAAPEVAASPVEQSTPSTPTGIAAAHDVPEVYSRDYAQGRARGFAEGLEEAAKVCEQNIYGTDEFQFGSRTCADAIRAKIKPTRGET